MFKNYLKIAYRNFSKNKFYSIINITGLSIGLACTMLILLFVTDEMSFDTFHENPDNIQFLGVERSFGGQMRQSRISAFPLGRTAVEDLPDAEMFVTMTPPNPARLSTDGETFFSGETAIAATSDFFKMFNFPLISGDPETVLSKPENVVITEEVAKKYFPGQDPINKTLTIDRYGVADYKVVGIAQKVNKNTYLDFDVVFSIEGLSSTQGNRTSWGASMYNTVVRLREGANREDVQQAMNDAFDVHIGERRAANTDYFFIPFSELYLSDLIVTSGFKGNYTYIYIFSAIALFILALGSINYMNLSTARGMQRGREVGVRKVLGADKKQLIQQFIGEAVIISLFSLLLAFILAELSLPYFNDFFSKDLNLNIIANIDFFIGLFVITIVFGALSGTYPALLLSRFRPSQILKSQGSVRLGGVNLRKALVVFQFSVSTVLIISTLVVSGQLNYLLNKDLGFNKDETVYISFNSDDNIESFKQSLENHPAVKSVSHANGVPGNIAFSMSSDFDPLRPEEQVGAHILAVDDNYHNTMGIEVLAGSFFDSERVSELEDAIIINEAMQKWMNWATPEEAIDQRLKDGDRIIAVVKDFHFRALRHEITPIILNPISVGSSSFSGNDMLVVQYQPEQEAEVLEYMKAGWGNMVSSDALNYTFMDDQMDRFYRTDAKLGNAFSFFAGIGILIACLGLFGLTAFSAERRTKEIGIRKVLGATVSNIIALLSKDFIMLVAIGFVVAIPIAWYFMNNWLTEFAYRIDIGLGVFLVAGISSLIIAGLTTSWQSIKAATVNPSNSLRSE